jgi:UrcA family protein
MKMLMLAALVAATTPLVPATAQTVTRSATVVTRDLDLTTGRDRRRLDLRVTRAAEAVCGDTSALDPVGTREAAQCRRDVVAEFAPTREALVARAGDVTVAAR